MSDRYADFFSVTAEALQFACERLRLPLTGDGHRRLLEQYGRLTPFADVGAALERLRALELPLAVLSNGSPGMLASMLAAAGMSGLFSHVLSADQVRKYKTAPQLYQLRGGCVPVSGVRTDVRFRQRMGRLLRHLVRISHLLGEPLR